MAATDLDTLRIAKVGSSTVYDIKDLYSIYLTEMPFLDEKVAKKPATRSFPDEHGVDSYDNDTTYFDAYDVTIKLCKVATSPTTAYNASKQLTALLTTSGSLHSVYSLWAGTGRTNVRFKSASKFELHRNNSTEYVLEWELVLTVEDPYTEVTL